MQKFPYIRVNGQGRENTSATKYTCEPLAAKKSVRYLSKSKFEVSLFQNLKTMLIDNKTISNIVFRIASNAKPDKIFLFGSYATGQANEDSDIDLLIVKDTLEPRHKRSIEIQRILKGSKLPVDILVYTNDEFEREKTINYSFVNSAIHGAKLLYERK